MYHSNQLAILLSLETGERRALLEALSAVEREELATH